MSDPGHERMMAAGLLDGDLDQGARVLWPEWARLHVEACEICQGLLETHKLLGVLARTRRGPPSVDQLRERLRGAQRSPPPLSTFVADGPGGMDVPWRGAAIEVVPDGDGARVWDPEARHLLVYGMGDGESGRARVHLAGEVRSEPGGIGVDVEAPTGLRAWVALSASAPMETELVTQWLWDVMRGGLVDELPLDDALLGRVRARVVEIRPELHPGSLPISSTPLPLPGEDVQALLSHSASLGKKGDYPAACRGYAQAADLAHANRDVAGHARARLGLSAGLWSMGFETDARSSLEELRRVELDDHHRAAFCRKMVQYSLFAGEVQPAKAWLAMARELGGENSWLGVLGAMLHAHCGETEEAVQACARLEDSALPPVTRYSVQLLESVALARGGARSRARERLATSRRLASDVAEVRLQELEVEYLLEMRDGSGLAGGVSSALDKDASAQVSLVQRLPVLGMAAEAWRRGQPDVAAQLLRSLHFADPGSIDSLVVESTEVGLLTVLPGLKEATRLPWTKQDFRSKLRKARERIQSGYPADAEVLRVMLEHDESQYWIASCGFLNEAPWAAVAWTGETPHRVVQRVTGQRLPPTTRTSDRVVSFADAEGDLPSARNEVPRLLADIWLRGREVRGETIRDLGPTGLLHIGVHATRARGIPHLRFADGAVTPAEICGWNIEGGPVVLLTGCATASGRSPWGVERSLADAFLRAGASAVVANLWPVKDAGMAEFVRALLDQWPFRDSALAVANARAVLRNSGASAATWAAPVLYG